MINGLNGGAYGRDPSSFHLDLRGGPGDARYKSAVQQAVMHIKPNTEGADQQITFPRIADQKVGVASVKLTATSDARVPVYYYVREGPVEVDGDTLKFSFRRAVNFPFK